jgi:hypothetical protein
MPGKWLAIEEREDIAYLLGRRMGVREIAPRPGQSPGRWRCRPRLVAASSWPGCERCRL